MKLVYIAGPYAAPTEALVKNNVRRAELAGQAVLAAGMIPVIPHKITSHWDTEPWSTLRHWTHDDWIDNFCKPLLDRCDAIFLIPGWTESVGCNLEFAHAKLGKIPVVFSVNELEELRKETRNES